MQELGKTLIIFGAILLVVGLLVTFINRVPFVGKLPGDIYIQRKHFTFYFPLTTSLLLGLLISLIFRIWSRR